MSSVQSFPLLGPCSIEGPKPSFERGSKVMLGVSVRNRVFSAAFLRLFFSFCNRFELVAGVLIIDEPYAWNDAATNGRSEPIAKELSRVRVLGRERMRLVERSARSVGFADFDFLDYQKLAATSLDLGIKQEFEAASSRSRTLNNRLLSQVRLFYNVPESSTHLFLGFQLQELPVLIVAYYHLGYLVDIYPGRNFPFFREFERGDWKDDLPISTALCAEQHLSFVSILNHL